MDLFILIFFLSLFDQRLAYTGVWKHLSAPFTFVYNYLGRKGVWDTFVRGLPIYPVGGIDTYHNTIAIETNTNLFRDAS
jgi:hypothetical protein